MFAWLASFRLRLLLRGAFLALIVALLAMAVALLQEEKQRGHANYRRALEQTKEHIVARLHHPAGQLALLNAPRGGRARAPGSPLQLPFAAIDFDDQTKAHHAVEMAGCLSRYPDDSRLCVGVGNGAWAGGFIYAVGSFASGELVPHRIGDEVLERSTRLAVEVTARNVTTRWLAPFETLPPTGAAPTAVRGRFTGYLARAAVAAPASYRGAMPVREFRGWVWQEGRCLDPILEAARAARALSEVNEAQRDPQAPAVGASLGQDDGANSSPPRSPFDCARRTLFSLRVPVEALRDAAVRRDRLDWPPADLERFQVRLRVLPPVDGEALFDSAAPGAQAPFALADLAGLLRPGERLTLTRHGAGAVPLVVEGRASEDTPTSPLLMRLIRRLPVSENDGPVDLGEDISSGAGSYHLALHGDARSANAALGAVATRVSWFLAAMLLAIGLAWLLIEVGIIRRIAVLTRRTRGLSSSMQREGGLERFDLADLRGRDELGLLAGSLHDLLRRVREDAEREHLRAVREKDQWHAVGHEIMSPLQSLLALHGTAESPSRRYLERMQRAVRVLYGSASPSEAFERTTLEMQSLDLDGFLRHVATNSGFECVSYSGPGQALMVRADEFPLEDVLAHLLRNADRHRQPGTTIQLLLRADENQATVTVHNVGAPIAESQLERIFEYGVSDQGDEGAAGQRGQGLFVARTYLAKMGGRIAARNEGDGVSFVLSLQRAG